MSDGTNPAAERRRYTPRLSPGARRRLYATLERLAQEQPEAQRKTLSALLQRETGCSHCQALQAWKAVGLIRSRPRAYNHNGGTMWNGPTMQRRFHWNVLGRTFLVDIRSTDDRFISHDEATAVRDLLKGMEAGR